MKTIKQVADTLGVSRQAIYRRLSALPSEMLSTNKKGVQLITVDGQAFLKDLLSDNSVREQSVNSSDSPANSTTDTLITMLQKELDIKNEQLAARDRQIEELTATIKIQAQSINAAHHNELAETVIDGQKMLSTPATEKEKVSLWNKIFKKKDKS